MEPTIRSLTLEGFRSFASATIAFDNPTFLVGPNGSGKSNLVDAFAFLAEAVSEPLRRVVENRGGFSQLATRSPRGESASSLSIGIEVENLVGDITGGTYRFSLHGRPDGGFFVASERCTSRARDGNEHYFERHITGEAGGYAEDFASSESWLKPTPEPGSLLLPLIGGGTAVFVPILTALTSFNICSIDPGTLRKDQLWSNQQPYRLDGSTTALELLDLSLYAHEGLVRIEQFLAAMLPYRVKVNVVQDGHDLSLRFDLESREGAITFTATEMSDGTLRALGILAALFQKNPPSLIVVEEPEASIHPHALGVVLDALELASRRMQVVVTTHSPDVLDAKWIEDRHLRLVNWDEASIVSLVSIASREAIRQRLMGAGELLRANALSPAEPFEPQLSKASAQRG